MSYRLPFRVADKRPVFIALDIVDLGFPVFVAACPMLNLIGVAHRSVCWVAQSFGPNVAVSAFYHFLSVCCGLLEDLKMNIRRSGKRQNLSMWIGWHQGQFIGTQQNATSRHVHDMSGNYVNIL
jgi:hypothetical protein